MFSLYSSSPCSHCTLRSPCFKETVRIWKTREQKDHGEKEETGRTESTVRTWRTREQKILEREETGRTTPFVRTVRVNVARNVRNDNIAACVPYDSLERSKVTGCLRTHTHTHNLSTIAKTQFLFPPKVRQPTGTEAEPTTSHLSPGERDN